MITVLSMITVATKNLIPRRIRIILEPFVKFGTMMIKSTGFSENIPVIVDVIQIQKKAFRLSAAGATVSPISDNSLVLEPVVVGKSDLFTLLGIFFGPLCSTLGSLSGMRLSVFGTIIRKVFFGSFRPIVSVFPKAFRTLTTVPLWLVFLSTAFHTDFNHGLSSVIETILDYGTHVKRKVQRLSLRRVGASVPKRIATRTVDDIVCSAWEHAAVLN
jgi:hypothetical protein